MKYKRYIYYRIFKWQERVWKSSGIGIQSKAIAALVVLDVLNVYTIILFAFHLLHQQMASIKGYTRLIGLSSAAVFFTIYYIII